MKNIYIHIGTHKTGSTAIQHALKEIDSELSLHEGWVYGAISTSKELMRAQRYDRKIVKRLSIEISNIIQLSRAEEKLILSSETLSGSPNNGYQNSKVAFSMLFDATKEYNVKIIIYLRRQDSFVESMYTQNIHEGKSIDFEDFLEGYKSKNALDYYRMLNELSSIFGEKNIIVRSYHDSSETGIINDFSRIIGSKSLNIPRKKERNTSYSRHALEIAKICNKSLDKSRKKKLRQALQTTMTKNRLDSFSYFTNEKREIFLNKYQASNKKVAERYFINNIENISCEKSITINTLQNQNLTHKEVAKLVLELLKKSHSDKGISAGIRTMLSDYPKLQEAIRRTRSNSIFIMIKLRNFFS